VANIKQALPEIKAYVVGPTEEYPDYYQECLALRNLLGLDDTIIFTGPANVVEYYRQFDVLLLTSVKEAMPLVVMEAMASGLPVVAIKASGIEDMVDNGKDGILTNNSVKEFSESVLKLVSDKALREKMAGQAEINSDKFSIGLWIVRMVKLYQSLIC